MNNDLKYLMALSYIPGLGVKSVKKLLQHYPDAQTIWNLSKIDKKSINLSLKLIDKIGSKKYLDLAQREIAFSQEKGIEITPIHSSHYPDLLRECVDAPPYLMSKGNRNWNEGKYVAIVGTRNMSVRAKDFIHELVSGFVGKPITIMSGLAFGVDAEAHLAAMENDLPTYAVLAHSVKEVFPKTNARIGMNMCEKGGLVSEFSSFHTPEPENFLRRNRIIAGMSHATIIVESRYKGGAMSTAAHANNYNRDVFAVAGRPNDVQSQGCHKLIKNHQAFLLTEANDVLKYLKLSQAKSQRSLQRELFVELTSDQQKVYDYLQKEEKAHIDQLVIATQLPVYVLLPVLLELEFKNLVESLPGKNYALI